MRTVAASTESAQAGGSAALVSPNYRLVANSVTYDETQIPHLLHFEGVNSQVATVILDNGDGSLDSLNVKGAQALISYGVESVYSQCAPLWVLDQYEELRQDGKKTVVLSLEGIPNRLARDEASEFFQPEPGDTTVIKTYLEQILTGTCVAYPAWVAGTTYDNSPHYVMPTTPNGWYYKLSAAGTAGSAEPTWPRGMSTTVADSSLTWTAWGRAATVYSHAPDYTVTVDSAEGLLTTLGPADGFRIERRENRWSVVSKLLQWARSTPRAEADSALHIIQPTVSGTAYAYNYSNTVVSGHTFFQKQYDQRMVTPNYVTVASMPGDTVQYTANTASTADNALLDVRTFANLYLASTAQANSVGAAMMTKAEMNADKGRIITPMNIGQEVFDYVRVLDADGNTVTGNVSGILRQASPGIYQMEMRLGAIDQARSMPLVPREVKDFDAFIKWFRNTYNDRLNQQLEEMQAGDNRQTVEANAHMLRSVGAHRGVPLVVMKRADQSVNASTALVNDDDLKLYLNAYDSYLLEMWLLQNSVSATSDFKAGWAYPANCLIYWGSDGNSWSPTGAGTTAATIGIQTTVNAYGSANGTQGMHLMALVVNAGTAGVLNFQWAQNTSVAESTKVLRASCLIAHRLEAP